ncbi:MAG TPA: PD-(D/E)XK nuclease family protein [Candidatus Nitrosotalea sp.]|nr:PD-(D/E)XK nuclease family protein [Candidatus Nitrosotalea sp.]
MQARFLLGPAGSGKTRRCLDEIRAELRRSPEGPPLLFLVPKQATFQLERQLLADPATPGYTRLQILSFDRLAEFILSGSELFDSEPEHLHSGPRGSNPMPAAPAAHKALLSDQGRVMVLRAILAQKQSDLEIFHSVARLPGFAQELSLLLRELQQNGLTPQRLNTLAGKLTASTARKLRDLATLLRAYQDWLKNNNLTDGDVLLELATTALRTQGANREWSVVSGQWSVAPDTGHRTPGHFHLSGLWLDGFAEMTPQELDLLAALIPQCDQATLAFCLEREPQDAPWWLSTWSAVARTFRSCHQKLTALPDCDVSVEVLERKRRPNRFSDNPVLKHLERHWANPEPWTGQITVGGQAQSAEPADSIRVAVCANPEMEAILAAQEILRHVRAGGRYRDCAVLLRSLEGYHDCLQRVFTRYEIPFFLDRREPVAHHPLAELTRHALRTAGFGWKHEDWFGALKTGLVSVEDENIDRLENEALARGWEGKAWRQPLPAPDNPELESFVERLRQVLIPPFCRLETRIQERDYHPNGAELAGALRELWQELKIEQQLEAWCRASENESRDGNRPAAIHSTVWEQMLDWLENLERAFAAYALPLREWLPILDSGMSGLTVGVVPPSLDQVLIGAVDRSRNPDLELVMVPGLNESVFPAPPQPNLLLTADERAAVEQAGGFIGNDVKVHLGRERYLGYVAFTRSRKRLVLSCANFDASGRKLDPSSFLTDLKNLFPQLPIEQFSSSPNWLDSLHVSDLTLPLLRLRDAEPPSSVFAELSGWPRVALALDQLGRFSSPATNETLSPEIADQLYGASLQTSVTRLEEFAACPFRFFVHSGLQTRERLRFEADTRETGRFQHEVLRQFHESLKAEGKEWRQLSPEAARRRIGDIAEDVRKTFGNGVLDATETSRFMARALTRALQDFIEVIVGWIDRQYEFNPAAAELRFGLDGAVPGWKLNLSNGHQLVFSGVIDRVDLLRLPGASTAHCIVVDYKSTARKIDVRLLENGIQLQLPAYLSVLRHVPEVRRLFSVEELLPAGIFYVSLAGQYRRGANRDDVLDEMDEARRLAYRHNGRFNTDVLPHLDNRPQPAGEEKVGDQFSFTITAKGKLHGRHESPMSSVDFHRMLDRVEEVLRQMAERIFRGDAAVDPYRLGAKTACDFCEYGSICRIDPWTHSFRSLRKSETSPA